MFELVWVDEARNQYEELKERAEAVKAAKAKKAKAKSSKEQGLFKQVHKALTLLAGNPKHPGLQTHEFESIQNPYDKKGKVFTAHAQQNTPGAYRVFWCYGPNKGEITVLAITPHP